MSNNLIFFEKLLTIQNQKKKKIAQKNQNSDLVMSIFIHLHLIPLAKVVVYKLHHELFQPSVTSQRTSSGDSLDTNI
ncbi:hypothetical protein BpHYR1_008833 [Brachionus plicatilis]|uniref:Uncharacterized protein n=1 Tax=Brachionus plicatilis TaxID=10195 RepID=A0A3M7R6S4_BRAPC|nr:hypothetical protein BpHYR1_008833 [Brachionus plicatilis]